MPDTELWQSWIPQLAQRVRVRRSAECRSNHHILDGSDDGLTGIIIATDIKVHVTGGDALHPGPATLTFRRPLVAQHDYFVAYDTPIPTGIKYPQTIKGQFYAAAELEPDDA